VILDSNILVTADISDLFGSVDTHDMAGVHAVRRAPNMMRLQGATVPRWFPVINTGLLAIRKNERTIAFCKAWEREVRINEAKVDQGYFRKTLYQSDLRFLSLPVEYNLIFLRALDNWPTAHGAPRILHSRALHERPDPGQPTVPFSLVEAVGAKRAAIVRNLITADWPLKGRRHLLNV